MIDGPIDHMQHLTMYLVNPCLKMIIANRHNVLKKKQLIPGKLEKEGKGVMYSSKVFNYNHMQFVGNETCDTLTFTSCEGCRYTNTISK